MGDVSLGLRATSRTGRGAGWRIDVRSVLVGYLASARGTKLSRTRPPPVVFFKCHNGACVREVMRFLHELAASSVVLYWSCFLLGLLQVVDVEVG